MNAEERRKYLSMAARRSKLGGGSLPTPVGEPGAGYGVPDVAGYLVGVRFIIVGGLATRLYMQERMTLDIDILVSPKDLPRVEQALAAAQCRKVGTLTIGGSTWRLPEDRNLDVIAVEEPWVEDALDAAVRGPDGQPYASLPYLVLMKLASGRMQDLADVGRMLGAAGEKALDEIKRLMEHWRPEDREDLDSLITLGKLEYPPPGAEGPDEG